MSTGVDTWDAGDAPGRITGDELWHTSLHAGTNTPVAVFGDTVVTAGTIPSGKSEKAQIIAYRLGATGTLAASGSSSPPPPTTTTSTPTTTTPGSSAGPGGSASGTVRLGAVDDQLAFNTDRATANAGEVTVDFTNNSALDHDVVLTDSHNKTLGQTPVFEGGTKSFTAKLAPGTYTYYCSAPGHRQAGMQGTLTVK